MSESDSGFSGDLDDLDAMLRNQQGEGRAPMKREGMKRRRRRMPIAHRTPRQLPPPPPPNPHVNE
jgi:hypothetical protein